ncbi:MAG TPA: YtxH domain-containing protein [Vicinamibacterales bacterium]|nr:YtxH domain-containing protein [Vicinamibacterales bacterium]
MREPVQVAAATVLGAVIGGVTGYLFFTNRGRRLRRDLEPRLDDLMRDVDRLRAALQKTARAADEGWRLLDEIANPPDRARDESWEATAPF